MNLLELIRKKRSLDIATATHAIPAITEPQTGLTVAKIATIAVANHKKEKTDTYIRDIKLCWSESEVALVKHRTAQFFLRGVPFADADALACRLVDRDHVLDDRRSCAECMNFVRGRCRRGIGPLGGGGVDALHRCKDFILAKDG